jgi:hypothetical protein
VRLTTSCYVEHQTSGQQEIGIQGYASAQLIVGGLCTSCQGCSSCSCTAAVHAVAKR